jgi:hypothetical protein
MNILAQKTSIKVFKPYLLILMLNQRSKTSNLKILNVFKKKCFFKWIKFFFIFIMNVLISINFIKKINYFIRFKSFLIVNKR